MKDTVCLYCGQESVVGAACPHCGASGSTVQPAAVQAERGEPFAYNGLIVWPLRDLVRDVVSYQFFLGDRLLETIEVSREVLHELAEQDPGADCMPLIWQMFEIAHGDRDMAILEDNRRRSPALIAMTSLEYPRERLTWEAVVEQYRRAPGEALRLG